MNDDTRALIDRADLDGLIRLVDNFCDSRDWDALADLRDACRAATQSGRQVWPASTLAEYRLALLAPADYAVEVLDDPGRFTIGPLTEVIAQHHSWAELSDLLDDGPQAAFVAHERAIRGEAIDDRIIDGGVFDVLDIPAALADWEPDYALAVYRDNDGVFDAPMPPPTEAVTITDTTPIDVASGVREAFAQLLAPWTESSNGRLALVAVEGDEHAALGALGVTSPRLGSMAGADAMRWLAWAGANGGAHGRRRGNAIGRFNAWWTVAALADLPWPPTPDAMRDALDALHWHWWEGDVTPTGWRLQLVVHDPRHNTTWIVDGRDAR
jgi:hypothetical protein